MAWRPSELLIEGILDNTIQGKVTGWMKFAGMNENVVFDLDGNFHRDIRGAKVRLRGDGESANPGNYMEGFALKQVGKVGDMTAGLPPKDYVDYGYFEWYGDSNGRCVIELATDQVELLAQPIPACESDPIDRKEQAENMAQYLSGMAEAVGIPKSHALSTSNTVAVEQAKKTVANDSIRGMKLMPKEVRETVPELYSQDGKGGKAIAHVKFFTPDGQWTWWATEFDGKDTFFGLVQGHEKELGYFSLTELESVKGPMGLPIERDLYFQPTALENIMPEMFA